MAPKRTTRSTPVTPTPNATPTTTVTEAQLQALIDQGVAAAMAEAEASRVRNGYNSNGSGPRPAQTARECSYSEFLKCKPLDFKGTEGVVGLTRWFKKMESVFSISNCTASCQVKFATCTLQDDALTWWNAHVKTTTPEAAHAMPWATLKKMMTDKYCPRGEIKKIETEMWNLKVKGTDVVAYSRRFQQLALMCSRMFPEEIDKIEKYIGGLPDMIHGSVKASKPKTMQEAIEFTTEELMDAEDHWHSDRKPYAGEHGHSIDWLPFEMNELSEATEIVSRQRLFKRTQFLTLGIDDFVLSASMVVVYSKIDTKGRSITTEGLRRRHLKDCFRPVTAIEFQKTSEELEEHLKLILEILRSPSIDSKTFMCSSKIESEGSKPGKRLLVELLSDFDYETLVITLGRKTLLLDALSWKREITIKEFELKCTKEVCYEDGISSFNQFCDRDLEVAGFASNFFEVIFRYGFRYLLGNDICVSSTNRRAKRPEDPLTLKDMLRDCTIDFGTVGEVNAQILGSRTQFTGTIEKDKSSKSAKDCKTLRIDRSVTPSEA
ncbi:putative reverse transcriptase domain-containing protein [Tanacetum coccineum]